MNSLFFSILQPTLCRPTFDVSLYIIVDLKGIILYCSRSLRPIFYINNSHLILIFQSSVRDMLSWTAEAISRPMLALSRDKNDKKIAIELFKLVQIYMGDRKARAGMSLNSVAIDIITSALPQQQ